MQSRPNVSLGLSLSPPPSAIGARYGHILSPFAIGARFGYIRSPLPRLVPAPLNGFGSSRNHGLQGASEKESAGRQPRATAAGRRLHLQHVFFLKQFVQLLRVDLHHHHRDVIRKPLRPKRRLPEGINVPVRGGKGGEFTIEGGEFAIGGVNSPSE
eukprot:342690-Prorocentrum_minimum.AAC.1